MRPVLAFGIVLLGVTLVVERLPAWRARPEGPALADRALEIIAGAKGPLLPAARFGSGPERIGEAIRLGDRTLVGDGTPGLRAAFVAADFGLLAERTYDVAHSQTEARALAAAVDEAREGELVVLASSGTLVPAGGDGAILERTLAALGARARLGAVTPESWAIIALRLERGWVPLAEGYSTESGVALAFVVSPRLEDYADFRGDFVHVRAPERTELTLEDELAHASRRTNGVALARDRSVQGQPLAGLLIPPRVDAQGAATPGRLAWEQVRLGSRPAFYALVGLADGAGDVSDGATYELRVNGELVKSHVVRPGARWRPMLVDLARFAGLSVTLELVVEPGATADGDAALWGRPTLLGGYDGSPLLRWAEER